MNAGFSFVTDCFKHRNLKVYLSTQTLRNWYVMKQLVKRCSNKRHATVKHISSGCSLHLFVSPWFSCGFPMVFPWFDYGCPVVFLSFLMVFLRFSYGFAMVLQWFSCGFPVVFLWFYFGSHRFSYSFLRFSRGFRMVLLWFSYGSPLVFRYFYFGSPMVFL